MGFIRTLLAISVVIGHTYPLWGHTLLINGAVAVRTFFIISGFYMALILQKKYSNYSLFITNRFLRIYPLYWLILIVSTMLDLFIFTNNLDKYSFSRMVSDITLIGRLDYFSLNPANNILAHIRIGPAWSLVIELLFYLMAPLLMKRKWVILSSVGIVSLFIRFYVYHFQATHGYQPTPDAFFPADLTFFILGIIAFNIYKKIYKKHIAHYILGLITLTMISFTLFYFYLPDVGVRYLSGREILYYISITISLPYTFKFLQKNIIDRLIGELSYPIYLWHMCISALIVRMLPSFQGSVIFALLVLFFSIVFSILSYKLLITPLDKYRDKRVKRTLAVDYVGQQ